MHWEDQGQGSSLTTQVSPSDSEERISSQGPESTSNDLQMAENGCNVPVDVGFEQSIPMF